MLPLTSASVLTAAESPAGMTRVYVGTYTGGSKSEGIYPSNLDLTNGR